MISKVLLVVGVIALAGVVSGCGVGAPQAKAPTSVGKVADAEKKAEMDRRARIR